MRCLAAGAARGGGGESGRGWRRGVFDDLLRVSGADDGEKRVGQFADVTRNRAWKSAADDRVGVGDELQTLREEVDQLQHRLEQRPSSKDGYGDDQRLAQPTSNENAETPWVKSAWMLATHEPLLRSITTSESWPPKRAKLSPNECI